MLIDNSTFYKLRVKKNLFCPQNPNELWHLWSNWESQTVRTKCGHFPTAETFCLLSCLSCLFLLDFKNKQKNTGHSLLCFTASSIKVYTEFRSFRSLNEANFKLRKAPNDWRWNIKTKLIGFCSSLTEAEWTRRNEEK